MFNITKLISARTLSISVLFISMFTVGLLSTTLQAANQADEDSIVSRNFKDVGRTLRKLRRADTPELIIEQLEKIKTLMAKNLTEIPSFMKVDTKLLDTYKTEIEKMQTGIDSLITKVKSGETEGGRAVVDLIKKLKEKSHKAVDLADD